MVNLAFSQHPLTVARRVTLGLLGLLLSLFLGGCGNLNTIELTLVSFSVTRAAYDQIIPAFEQLWLKEHQQHVSIRPSYGSSGAQARAVIDGLSADIVHLSLGLDVDRIAAAGLMATDWQNRAPFQSVVARSVVALVTRPGNPKNIHNWEDLVRPDISIITANPKTSGGARWIFLGLWTGILGGGGTANQAFNFTTQAFRQAPILTRDAREATDVFLKKGQGDVLLNYENEVILAQQREQKLSYDIPPINISIDSPVAWVDTYVEQHQTREIATAFIDYLYSDPAQEMFAAVGFRPVNTDTNSKVSSQFLPLQELVTIEELGGWPAVQEEFFRDGAIFDQIIEEIR